MTKRFFTFSSDAALLMLPIAITHKHCLFVDLDVGRCRAEDESIVRLWLCPGAGLTVLEIVRNRCRSTSRALEELVAGDTKAGLSSLRYLRAATWALGLDS